MTSKQPGQPRVHCGLILIKPENEQIRLDCIIIFLNGQKLHFLCVLNPVLTIYAQNVFRSRQSLRYFVFRQNTHLNLVLDLNCSYYLLYEKVHLSFFQVNFDQTNHIQRGAFTDWSYFTPEFPAISQPGSSQTNPFRFVGQLQQKPWSARKRFLHISLLMQIERIFSCVYYSCYLLALLSCKRSNV